MQEHERCDFREALEILARRAGITLEKKGASPHRQGRALMLEVVRWAADQYHQCLLSSPLDSSSFMHWGLAGKGRWLTVYTNPGHAFLIVAGLRFDTGWRDSSVKGT